MENNNDAVDEGVQLDLYELAKDGACVESNSIENGRLLPVRRVRYFKKNGNTEFICEQAVLCSRNGVGRSLLLTFVPLDEWDKDTKQKTMKRASGNQHLIILEEPEEDEKHLDALRKHDLIIDNAEFEERNGY